MKSVIGKRYITSKSAIVVLLSLLFFLIVGLGIYISVCVRREYLAEVDLYEIEMISYRYGLSETLPTPPIEPVWKYFLYVGLSIVIGSVSCGLFYYGFSLEKKREQEIIIYDASKKTLFIYSDGSYEEIFINSITDMRQPIIPGGVFTGRIFVPHMHRSNKIIFTYTENGSKFSVTSDPVIEAEQVISKIESLKRKSNG